MALYLRNGYTRTINVSIMYYSPNECPTGPDCPPGQDWMVKGWWVLEPGAQKCPYGGELANHNRYWCFYAESVDGLVWSGPYSAQVSDHAAFHNCRCVGVSVSDGPGWPSVGFRLFDVQDEDDWTITLVK